MLKTVEGEPLAVEVQGKKVYVTDVQGQHRHRDHRRT